MTDRSTFDRPATVTAAVLGVVLIGVSAPFTAQLWNETADTWVVSWVPEDLAATSVPVAGTSGTQSAQFTVEGRHVAVLTVTLPSCVDAFQAPVQSGGTITWSLSSGGEELASETVSCADADGYAFAVEVHAAPSLGEVEAASREDAEEAAAETLASLRETVTYDLEVVWSHPATLPVPLPAGEPTFDAEVAVTPSAWTYAVAEPSDEVVR